MSAQMGKATALACEYDQTLDQAESARHAGNAADEQRAIARALKIRNDLRAAFPGMSVDALLKAQTK